MLVLLIALVQECLKSISISQNSEVIQIGGYTF